VVRAEEGGHAVAALLSKALAASTLDRAIERLRSEVALLYPRGVAEAATVRLEAVSKYIVLHPLPNAGLNGLSEGVYLLAEIANIWERAAIQQFLATFAVLSRPPASLPQLLVIEEGGMGKCTTFLRHLLALARRRGVKVIFISQGPSPPPELRGSFEVLLFDSDPELRRTLRAPIPDSPLKPGECWWVRRAGAPKKLRFRR
jgi:hypothetical protein